MIAGRTLRPLLQVASFMNDLVLDGCEFRGALGIGECLEKKPPI